MKKLEYTVRFITPAFLGNAEQAGQWRTPPFKALLRQWWRVAYAADNNFNVNIADMRQEEGRLFGHAWLENDHDDLGNKVGGRKSRVRMRLDRWGIGKLTSWQGLPPVLHPEVHRAVGSDLYLGYGPLTLPRGERQPTLKAKAAIQAGESARISLAIPDDHESRIGYAVWLMRHYGALGGRSRNGWGSLSFEPENEDSRRALEGHSAPLQDWTACLNTDWPCAIGQDRRPLIWQTQPFGDWKDLMKRLAEIKIGLRTQFTFPDVPPPHPRPLPRHWLSYPVTKHATLAWDASARLPNTLRFNARPTIDGKVIGVVVHVPHLPPAAFQPDRRSIENVWQQVHAFLDADGRQLTRIPE